MSVLFCASTVFAQEQHGTDPSVEIAVVNTPSDHREALVLRAVVVGDENKNKELVYPPQTRSLSEGWDLALEFAIEYKQPYKEEFSKVTLLYANGSTYAYQILSDQSNPKKGVVIVSENVANIYLNDYYLSKRVGDYGIVVRYKHFHGGLLGKGYPKEQKITEAETLWIEKTKSAP